MTPEPAWLEPTYTGPTWQKDTFGQYALPERTLGWEAIGWIGKYLQNPDGTAWELTDEQARFILWWYELNEAGEFVSNTGVLQRSKGWGKDPLLACISLFEFVGPCRFDYWDDDGEAVGKTCPNAWVVVSAVSRDQTVNTMSLIPSLLSPLAISTYGIKVGAELLRAHDGKHRLEAVTSSYRSLEGKRATFSMMNETHHWVPSQQGDLMYSTIKNNASKMNARIMAISNAFMPGEESVAEVMRDTYEKILEGRAVDFGFMYDSIEAHPETPLTPEALEAIIPKIRGDAWWLNTKAIIANVQDLSVSPARARRFWLNQIVASEDALFGPEDWVPLTVEGLHLKPGDSITLGFDGGKTEDSTALVAIREKDMAVFLLGIWEKPVGSEGEGWQVPRERVENAVHYAFREFNVLGFYSDVNLWESHIADWEHLYGEQLAVKSTAAKPIAWDMRQSLQKVTRANERLVRAILEAKFKHDGNRTLRRHILNVMRRENNYGVSFGKESAGSDRKIDAYAAFLLAYECLLDFRGRGKAEKPRTKRGYFV